MAQFLFLCEALSEPESFRLPRIMVQGTGTAIRQSSRILQWQDPKRSAPFFSDHQFSGQNFISSPLETTRDYVDVSETQSAFRKPASTALP
jgi:hypothetical protein